MNRRSFLAAPAAGLVLDSDRLLWRPGAKLISIPKPAPLIIRGWALGPLLAIGDEITFGSDPTRYNITGVFESDSEAGFTIEMLRKDAEVLRERLRLSRQHPRRHLSPRLA